jgi:DNA-binding CsgD family transcriptional regulator
MELLEREQFLSELETILSDVAAGNGRLVIVSGEAGIGKTSLVERFAETNKQSARVLWGACDALFTPRPLGPLYDIAHQTRGPLLSLLDDEAARSSIFSAFLDELQNAHAPTIAVTEDVHWADEATLDLLKFLGRRINRTNSMLVVTYRDDELAANHPLRLFLGDLPPRSVARVRLPPLSESGVNTLAQGEGRLVEDLYPVTGGNPFFVTEALASKERGVPETVRDAVLSRAARLSPEARAVVELVSAVPARTELWLLKETVSPGQGVLEEAVGAGMLRYEGEAISFRHELARRAVEDSLSVPERKRLHAAILKALLRRNAADRRQSGSGILPERGHDALTARIVHHASHTDDREAVLEYAPLAARQAAALNAHREAAIHYQTALQFAGAHAPEERAGLLERRSYECFLTDQIEEALAARREALEIWTGLGDKRRQGDNLRWMSRFTWTLGRNKEAEIYSSEAVKILEGLGTGPELAMAYSNRAQLHMLADETPEAVLWGSRAIELAEKIGATEILVHALNNVGSAQMLADDEQGRITLEKSLQLASAHNLHEHVCRANTNLADHMLRGRNYAAARRWLEAGIAHAIEHELDFCRLYLVAGQARADFEQGDWDRAADDAGSLLERHRVPAITKIAALAVLGHVRVRRGDPAAVELLNEARELAIETGEPQRIAPVASARAEFAWLRGDLAQMISEARSFLDVARGRGGPWLQGEFAFWLWRAGVVADVPKVAAPYALQMKGDWRAAAAAWKQIGCPYEEAMALADGDGTAKLSAVETLEKLGAGPALERLRKTLRETGVRGIPRGPRPSTKENPAGLTNRQMEVLAFMSEGLSNAEIAERLFISAKTVDHHVSAILGKLDARTRAEAVAVALQSNLIKGQYRER